MSLQLETDWDNLEDFVVVVQEFKYMQKARLLKI
jgi:hypothetical protein